MAFRFIVILTLSLVSLCQIAAAQTPAPKPQEPATKSQTAAAPATPQGFKSSQMSMQRDGTRWLLRGQVELEHDSGVKFFADAAEYDTETHIVTAKGNVVLVNAEGRI